MRSIEYYIPLFVSVSSKLNNQENKISPLLYNNQAQINRVENLLPTSGRQACGLLFSLAVVVYSVVVVVVVVVGSVLAILNLIGTNIINGGYIVLQVLINSLKQFQSRFSQVLFVKYSYIWASESLVMSTIRIV